MGHEPVKPINNRTEAQLHRDWIHRPSDLKQMSFAEWKKRDNPTEATVAPTPKSGRVKHTSGKMNNLEARYAAHLELRKTAGEILDYRFEPMKLRLAPSTFFDIDFLVVQADDQGKFGSVELHEVKGGHWEDDARVKIKVAAPMFPWWRFRGVQWDKEVKDWKFEEFRG
jgi:hypothetical protein